MDVIVTPAVEPATPRDVEALAALRLAQRWHANRRLLETLVEWEGSQIFIIRDPDADGMDGGVLACTAATACDGVGVIGNVIVREDQQRKGLGRMVMTAALDWMRGRGVRSALLDATAEGRPLYRKLGFVPYGMSYFAHGSVETVRRGTLAAEAAGLMAPRRDVSALDTLAALDWAAFGGDRLGLLARILAEPQTGLYVAADGSGAPSGYIIVRPQPAPRVGVRIGPWVARDRRAAAAALAASLGEDAPWRAATGNATEAERDIHVSLPGTSAGALALLGALGMRVVEDDVLMQLDFAGHDTAPTSREELRAFAAHPEWVYGWLAPMVF